MNDIALKAGQSMDFNYEGLVFRVTALGGGVVEVRPLNNVYSIGRSQDNTALWITIERKAGVPFPGIPRL